MADHLGPNGEAEASRHKVRGDSQEDLSRKLAASVIALPLTEEMAAHPNRRVHVIIDLNLMYRGTSDNESLMTGRDRARAQVHALLQKVLRRKDVAATQAGQSGVDVRKTRLSDQYIFAELLPKQIINLVRLDRLEASGGPASGMRAGDEGATGTTAHAAQSALASMPRSLATSPNQAVYRIWLDHAIEPLMNHTVRTVKADAAQVAFGCSGDGIVWAVVDSGIDSTHLHFGKYENLALAPPLEHQDFTAGGTPQTALTDVFGHGSHVAGIIAGELRKEWLPDGQSIVSYTRRLADDTNTEYVDENPERMCAIAPHAKLLSLKVLDNDGQGKVSNIIAALTYIRRINGDGRKLLIHGVNLSVGYPFDAEWFACGQSPLCVEVDLLVRSGVVVVVAAGNSGYGTAQSIRGPFRTGLDLSINDPGNAEMAITVGATHRDMPHVYGVSYFSSKGPTGDGRDKPDLVAPGEKILSCATGKPRDTIAATTHAVPLYREESGTSMAAPHVSGAIAAFLSVRNEYIGKPEAVKEIFLSSATDLKRNGYFQGRGLLDMMRAIQSV